MELFTGLPSSTLLDIVFVPGERIPRDLPMDSEGIKAAVNQLRQALQLLHTEVTERKERKERKQHYQMAQARGTVCNSEVGDYVLWSRIDERLRGHNPLVR